MQSIAYTLNSEGVVTPMERRKQLKGSVLDKPSYWNDRTVRNILMQDIYTGDMVQGKTKSFSHKVQKRVPVPREEWIIVPNTHEPIIDKGTFETVQNMLKLKSKPMRKKNSTAPSVLNGLLICKDCGKKMQRTIVNKGNTEYYYYTCSTFKKLGNDACSSHQINETVVLDTIIITLNTLIDNMIDVEKAMNKSNKKLVEKAKQRTKRSLDLIIHDLNNAKTAKASLYSDYANCDISKTDYDDMKVLFDEQCTSLSDKKNRLEQEILDYENSNLFNNRAICTYKQYKGIDILDRKTAVDLISKIIVNNENSIKIIFKFEDEIKKYQYNL